MPPPEQWQLSGNAAELYERYVVPYILGPWAPGLVALAALQPGERVLDVACGTGVVARHAAPKVGRAGHVTGLDLNPGMLAVARSLPPPSGAPITWVESSAVAMDVPEASCDVVLCQQGLQFFPDKPAALREMHRVLVPGGRIVLSVWSKANPYGTALSDAVGQHVSAEAAARINAPQGLADAGDRELHRLMVEAGFEGVTIHSRTMITRLPLPEAFVLWHLAAMPVAAEVAALSEEARTALVRDVRTALLSYIEDNGVAFPSDANLVVAHT
jgi:ubiquinone/menaquinone biosynthesis C-methylase UbiE